MSQDRIWKSENFYGFAKFVRFVGGASQRFLALDYSSVGEKAPVVSAASGFLAPGRLTLVITLVGCIGGVATRLSLSTTLPELVRARVRRARAHFRIVYYFISSHV